MDDLGNKLGNREKPWKGALGRAMEADSKSKRPEPTKKSSKKDDKKSKK